MVLELNQFQDIFFLYNKNIVVDYLLGTIKILEKEDTPKQICYVTSEKYKNYEKILREKCNSDSKEMTIVLIPSYNCNMECEYCYEGHQKYNSDIITMKECEKIIEYLVKQDLDLVSFVLLGGEPIYEMNLTILKFFFKKLSDYAIDYTVGCVSNGLEISDQIEDILNMHITQFQITLDGIESMHNKRKKSKLSNKNPYIEVCNSIDMLLKNKISVDLRINVDQENVNEIVSIAKVIREKNWNKYDNFSVYIYPVTFSGNDCDKSYKSEYQILQKVINEIEKEPWIEDLIELDFHGIDFIKNVLQGNIFVPQISFCSSCKNQLVFDGNNKIYTCWWGSNNKEFSVGEFSEDVIVVDKNKLNKWRAHSVRVIEKCEHCKYKYVCGGGCVFKAFTKYNTLDEGNCSEFYNNIKIYLEHIFSTEDLYKKLYKRKWQMIEQFLEDENCLIVKAEGGSMKPTICDGEKIGIEKKKQQYCVNDIVAYLSKEELKVHRIVEIKNGDICTMKGDGERYQEYFRKGNKGMQCKKIF